MDELTRCTVLGLPPEAGVKRLEGMVNKECKNASAHAATLLRTESARIASIAEKDAYDALGTEKYVISATLDEKTSEICQEMDGKVFDVKDMEPGINAPPFHPNCRSTTCPYFEDYETPTRAARDPVTGKTYTEENVPYKEWKQRWEEKFSPIQEHEKSGKHSKETRQDEDKKGIIKPEEIKRLNDIGFATVDPSWGEMGLEEREIFMDTMEFLESRYGALQQGLNCIRCEDLDAVRAQVSFADNTFKNKILTYNSRKFLDNEYLYSMIYHEVLAGYHSQIDTTEQNIKKYVFVHEYGHLVQANEFAKYLEGQIKIPNEKDWAIIQYYTYTQKCRSEILEIALQIDPDFDVMDCFQSSKYGRVKPSEFFAESFVNAHLGATTTIGLAILEWLKKKGY